MRQIVYGTAFTLLAGLAAAAISLALREDAPPLAHAQVPGPELFIEILPGGFNPQECTINRNLRARVRFVNTDTKPRRIVVDELYAPEPGGFARDTGWIEPGETQDGYWTFAEIQNLTYRDHDDPSLTGKIIVPLSNNAGTLCDQQEPTPEPTGEGCARHFEVPVGCAFVPRATSDGPPQ